MRVDLKILLEKLGVNRVLQPYETQPWVLHDEATSTTCSAEVRMGPSNADLEAEIQFFKDESDQVSAGPEQIMLMRALPSNEGVWSPNFLLVKGESYVNQMAEWEEKGCNFFKACIQSILMGELPNVDELIEKELGDDDFGGGRRGRVGRKAPKVKPGALLGMKKPGGM